MSQLPKTLQDFQLFIDGSGYAGKVPELTLPKVASRTQEYLAGGMAAPIMMDMGPAELSASFTLAEFSEDVLRLYGARNLDAVQATFRGALEREDIGEVTPIEIAMRGRWEEIDFGTVKKGDSSTMPVKMQLSYFRYRSNGADLIEIDTLNNRLIVGGVDRFAERRAAIGQ